MTEKLPGEQLEASEDSHSVTTKPELRGKGTPCQTGLQRVKDKPEVGSPKGLRMFLAGRQMNCSLGFVGESDL